MPKGFESGFSLLRVQSFSREYHWHLLPTPNICIYIRRVSPVLLTVIFYIMQYPVLGTDQSAVHYTPVQSNTISASGKHPVMLQVMCEDFIHK